MEKKAIIVGASSGIGHEVAKLLLADGWRLGVAARREEKLRELQALAPERVEIMAIDVTSDDADQRLLALIDRLGGIDLYFHASGIGFQNRELDADIELRTAETNAKGFMRMVGAAYRYFAASSRPPREGANSSSGEQAEKGATPRGGREGVIAAITSIAGTKGLGPAPAYSATKALQAAYLEALEQQACQRGLPIHILDIRPGFVDTALLRPSDPSKEAAFTYPMMMRPADVARDIVRSIYKRRHVRIIDWRYRLLTAAWRLIPRWAWRRFKL